MTVGCVVALVVVPFASIAVAMDVCERGVDVSIALAFGTAPTHEAIVVAADLHLYDAWTTLPSR